MLDKYTYSKYIDLITWNK